MSHKLLSLARCVWVCIYTQNINTFQLLMYHFLSCIEEITPIAFCHRCLFLKRGCKYRHIGFQHRKKSQILDNHIHDDLCVSGIYIFASFTVLQEYKELFPRRFSPKKFKLARMFNSALVSKMQLLVKYFGML